MQNCEMWYSYLEVGFRDEAIDGGMPVEKRLKLLVGDDELLRVAQSFFSLILSGD